MAEIIIFGIRDTAELAAYYLKKDTSHTIAAFTVTQSSMPESKTFCDRPVVPWESLQDLYSPQKYKLFVPMTGKGMNKLRERFYLEGKTKGYEYISYISPHATVCDNEIGENCFILEDNTLQPFTRIGNNVVLWSGNHIGHHGEIEDHVFFTSHVVLSGHCKVGKYSWIGVNATIRDGITIEEGTFIAAGALVTKNTESWKTYLGAPARPKGGSLEANP